MPALPGHCQPLPLCARTVTDTNQQTSRHLLSLINKTAMLYSASSHSDRDQEHVSRGTTFRSAFLTGSCQFPI